MMHETFIGPRPYHTSTESPSSALAFGQLLAPLSPPRSNQPCSWQSDDRPR
jgi:hypothetical protein